MPVSGATERAEAIGAADAERRRIVRDLHDGVQQRLVALRIGVGLAMDQVTRTEHELDVMAHLGEELELTIDELRELTRGYLARSLNAVGIAEALRSATARWPNDVRIRSRGLRRYDERTEEATYNICLEALRDARFHAGPGATMVVSLAERKGRIAFVIRDDGRGFDPAVSHAGVGLTNISDRAVLAGGCVRIASAAGHGVAVRGSVPIGPARPALAG
jgi:signal transduction histidine kinase